MSGGNINMYYIRNMVMEKKRVDNKFLPSIFLDSKYIKAVGMIYCLNCIIKQVPHDRPNSWHDARDYSHWGIRDTWESREAGGANFNLSNSHINFLLENRSILNWRRYQFPRHVPTPAEQCRSFIGGPFTRVGKNKCTPLLFEALLFRSFASDTKSCNLKTVCASSSRLDGQLLELWAGL